MSDSMIGDQNALRAVFNPSPMQPYILVLNVENQGEQVYQKPIVVRDKILAFTSVDDAVAAAESFFERMRAGKENLPLHNFDRIQLYIAHGYADDLGVDYGTVFAIVDSKLGRLIDYP